MNNSGFLFQYMQSVYNPAIYTFNYPLFSVPFYQTTENANILNSAYIQRPFQNTKAYKAKKQLLFTDQIEEDRYSPQKSQEQFVQSNDQKENKKRKYYGSKNTEVNIINQTFSFMNSCNKSKKVLEKILNDDAKKVETFYSMIKIVKRNLKKYVNRIYLRSIFDMQDNNTVYKMLSKGVKRLQILSMQQFKTTFRKLVFYYFNNQMTTHILSSNRLSKNTINENLKRRREIMHFIFQQRKFFL